MSDRKYLENLRRSPIQRQNQTLLKELNDEINNIDLSGVLKAHEQRKVKQNTYKIDKNNTIGKIKEQLNQQKQNE
jgi:hypothetical protein